VLTAAGAVLTGRSSSVAFSVPQSLYFSVTLVAGAATFLAVGTLASQLAGSRRQAAAAAAAVFGIAYALRMVADSDAALRWLVWLSPLGWIEESRPLTHPDPAALLPVLALAAVLVAVAVHLAGTRDLGSATLAGRGMAEPHLALLNGPVGLNLRLSRAAATGWLLTVAVFALLFGSLADSNAKDAAGSAGIGRALARLGAHGSPADAYLGLTFLVLALVAGMMAAGQVTAIRSTESEADSKTS
jgi:ABC-2 type transport system permease protein